MKTNIIYTLTTLLVIISLSFASAQEASDVLVPLTNPANRGKLKAHLNFGSITVKGTPRKDILVKYAPEISSNDDHKNPKKDGMRKIGGGGMGLEIVEHDNVVTVGSESWNTKLNLEIEIPSGFDLQVSAHNEGHLIVTNVQGDVELTNFNGSITALNISGSVMATTYNGDVKVTFDKVKDNVPMSYSTFNGDIDISFPASVKGALKLKTEQGEIYTDFDVAIKSSGPVQKKDAKAGVYKVTIDEWKRGDLNGGGAEITMKNYNGDIYIRKK